MKERYKVLYKRTIGESGLIWRARKAFLEGGTGEREGEWAFLAEETAKALRWKEKDTFEKMKDSQYVYSPVSWEKYPWDSSRLENKTRNKPLKLASKLRPEGLRLLNYIGLSFLNWPHTRDPGGPRVAFTMLPGSFSGGKYPG